MDHNQFTAKKNIHLGRVLVLFVLGTILVGAGLLGNSEKLAIKQVSAACKNQSAIDSCNSSNAAVTTCRNERNTCQEGCGTNATCYSACKTCSGGIVTCPSCESDVVPTTTPTPGGNGGSGGLGPCGAFNGTSCNPCGGTYAVSNNQCICAGTQCPIPTPNPNTGGNTGSACNGASATSVANACASANCNTQISYCTCTGTVNAQVQVSCTPKNPLPTPGAGATPLTNCTINDVGKPCTTGVNNGTCTVITGGATQYPSCQINNLNDRECTGLAGPCTSGGLAGKCSLTGIGGKYYCNTDGNNFNFTGECSGFGIKDKTGSCKCYENGQPSTDGKTCTAKQSGSNEQAAACAGKSLASSCNYTPNNGTTYSGYCLLGADGKLFCGTPGNSSSSSSNTGGGTGGSTPPAASSGSLDTVNCEPNGVRGWFVKGGTWGTGATAGPEPIGVIIDEKRPKQSEAVTGEYRPHVPQNLGVNYGTHTGFVYTIPNEYRDGKQHELTVFHYTPWIAGNLGSKAKFTCASLCLKKAQGDANCDDVISDADFALWKGTYDYGVTMCKRDTKIPSDIAWLTPKGITPIDADLFNPVCTKLADKSDGIVINFKGTGAPNYHVRVALKDKENDNTGGYRLFWKQDITNDNPINVVLPNEFPNGQTLPKNGEYSVWIHSAKSTIEAASEEGAAVQKIIKCDADIAAANAAKLPGAQVDAPVAGPVIQCATDTDCIDNMRCIANICKKITAAEPPIANTACTTIESNKNTDFNNDGKSDIIDYEIWRSNSSSGTYDSQCKIIEEVSSSSSSLSIVAETSEYKVTAANCENLTIAGKKTIRATAKEVGGTAVSESTINIVTDRTLNVNLAPLGYPASKTITITSLDTATQAAEKTRSFTITCNDNQVKACSAGSGVYKDLPNSCADKCGTKGNICGQSVTKGCDCGADKCWDGKSCVQDVFTTKYPSVYDVLTVRCDGMSFAGKVSKRLLANYTDKSLNGAELNRVTATVNIYPERTTNLSATPQKVDFTRTYTVEPDGATLGKDTYTLNCAADLSRNL
jgi:hypothetical protein